MKHFISLVLIVCKLISLCNGQCSVYEYGVSKEEKKYIVDEHNNLRLKLAHGNVPNQPKAINLKKLVWDDYLAGQAQNIANTCIYKHVKVDDKRFYVGQNLARNRYSAYEPSANWTFAIYIWWDEYKLYTYPDGFSEDAGHYTQVAWADTKYVGCGYTFFPKKDGPFNYQKLYVCNYGPAGNSGGPPYKTGSSGCENLC